MTRSLHLLLALLGLAMFTGCPPSGSEGDDDDSAADDDDDDAPDALEGHFLDGWGTFHTVTADTWTSGSYPGTSTYAISQVHASDGFLVAQNGAGNAWNPNLWSRFDWHTDDDGDLWYCQVAFDAADEDAALNTDAPDASDPANSGCGGFNWTQLEEHEQGALTLVGDFIDGWGTHHSLRQDAWVTASGDSKSAYAVSQYSNADLWIVAQNGSENEWNPDLWSRFDLTEHNGDWYYCQTAFDAADEAAALGTEAADPSDPENTGCGGFNWTNLGTDQGLFALIGGYTDSWGTEHVVEQGLWTTGPETASEATYLISQYDNANNWALALNGADNEWNPNLWSRFEWTEHMGATWYCQVVFDAATAEDALLAPAADPSDPANSGCGGFNWTNLTP